MASWYVSVDTRGSVRGCVWPGCCEKSSSLISDGRSVTVMCFSARAVISLRGGCIHYVNGWKSNREDTSGDNDGTNMTDWVILDLNSKFNATLTICTHDGCIVNYILAYLLILSPIWEEAHQETDKAGPKAHQWAVTPAERIGRRKHNRRNKTDTNLVDCFNCNKISIMLFL